MTDQIETIVCPSCGTQNPVSSLSCKDCGENLEVVKGVINSATKHYNSALAMAEKNLVDHAIVEVQAAIDLWTQNPHFHNLLGTLYAKKGLLDKAVEEWKKTLSLDPNMEKAAGNIEKARRFELSEKTSDEKRPFQIACAVLGVLLFAALIWGGLLRENVAPYKDEIASLNKDLAKYKTQSDAAEEWLMELTPAESGAPFEDLIEGAADVLNASADNIAQLKTDLGTTSQLLEDREKESAEVRKEIVKRDTEIDGLKKEVETLKNKPAPKPLISAADLDNLRKERKALTEQVGTLKADLVKSATEAQAAGKRADELAVNLEKTTKDLDKAQKDVQDLTARLALVTNERTALENEKTRISGILQSESKRANDYLDLTNLLVNQRWGAAKTRLVGITEGGDSAPAGFMEPLTALAEQESDPFEQEFGKYTDNLRAQKQEELKKQFARDLVNNARSTAKQQQFDRAVELLNRAEIIDPNASAIPGVREEIEKERLKTGATVESLFAQADLEIGEGKLQEAEATLNSITPMVGEDQAALDRLAVAKSNLESLITEEDAKTAALGEDLGRVKALRDQNRIRDARSFLLDMRGIYGENPKIEGVLAEVNTEIETKNRAVPGMMANAESMFAAHEYDEAVRITTEILAWDDTHQRARNLRDECEKRNVEILDGIKKTQTKIEQQKYTEAKRAVTEVLKIDPDNETARTLLKDIENSLAGGTQ